MSHHNYLRKGTAKTAAKAYKRGHRKVPHKKRFGKILSPMIEL